jgi:hypothetical protein
VGATVKQGVGVRLSESQLEDWRKQATEEGFDSLAAWIRKIVNRYLQSLEGDHGPLQTP